MLNWYLKLCQKVNRGGKETQFTHLGSVKQTSAQYLGKPALWNPQRGYVLAQSSTLSGLSQTQQAQIQWMCKRATYKSAFSMPHHGASPPATNIFVRRPGMIEYTMWKLCCQAPSEGQKTPNQINVQTAHLQIRSHMRTVRISAEKWFKQTQSKRWITSCTELTLWADRTSLKPKTVYSGIYPTSSSRWQRLNRYPVASSLFLGRDFVFCKGLAINYGLRPQEQKITRRGGISGHRR